MKRVVSLILCLCVMLSMSVFASAITFSDLASNHWAYENIMSLVNEGTINGYEDGTFRPSKTVTRAEFAKMIGKWNQKNSGKYIDISEEHWAYDYIMWSGLDATGSMIYPDTEIKRGDVINLIWKRNGSPKHNAAPSAITMQGTNPDAASWAYTIGLMKGDDGLNLRLDGSLTRAEAATLIIRSREMVKANAANSFIDVVDGELLKKTYDSLNLLDESYNSDKVLTYGEIARMSIVLGADGSDIKFSANDRLDADGKVGEFFEHKYSNEMFILSNKVWGKENYTSAKIDTPATVQDAVSSIMYSFTRRGTTPSDLGEQNNYYSDCKDANSTTLENLYLTYANTHGVKCYSNGKLGAQEPVTVKKYAALMLQFNEIIGLGIGYTNGTKVAVKMNTYLSSYPANNADFYRLISGVPVGVYNLKNSGVSAKSSYNALNKLSFVYTACLDEIVAYAKSNTGCTMSATYYPSVSYKVNGKVVFTAKFSVISNTDGSDISIDKLFGDMIKSPTEKTVSGNEDFYVVFETYEPLMDVYLPRSGVYVKGVFVD